MDAEGFGFDGFEAVAPEALIVAGDFGQLMPLAIAAVEDSVVLHGGARTMPRSTASCEVNVSWRMKPVSKVI